MLAYIILFAMIMIVSLAYIAAGTGNKAANLRFMVSLGLGIYGLMFCLLAHLFGFDILATVLGLLFFSAICCLFGIIQAFINRSIPLPIDELPQCIDATEFETASEIPTLMDNSSNPYSSPRAKFK